MAELTTGEKINLGTQSLSTVLGGISKSKQYKEAARVASFSAEQSQLLAQETIDRFAINRAAREGTGRQERSMAHLAGLSSGFTADYSTSALSASLRMELSDISSMEREAKFTQQQHLLQAEEFKRQADAAKKAQKKSKLGVGLSILGGIAGMALTSGSPVGGAIGVQAGSALGQLAG